MRRPSPGRAASLRSAFRSRRSFPACLFLLALTACLRDYPLVTAENAYDPKVVLQRDSLARFDSVEILLVDAGDTSRAVHSWKGRIQSTDTLGTQFAGDGRTLVFIVKGYRADRGLCFTEMLSQAGERTVHLDFCDSILAPPPDTSHKEPPKEDPPEEDPPKEPEAVLPRFAPADADFGGSDTLLYLALTGGSRPYDVTLHSASEWIRIEPPSLRLAGDSAVRVFLDRKRMQPGTWVDAIELKAGGEPVDTVLIHSTVPPPRARVTAKAVEWRDSLPQAGLLVILDGAGTGAVTDARGEAAFNGVAPGAHALSFSAGGRIGAADTFTVGEDGRDLRRVVAVAPASEFMPVDPGWSRYVARVAVAGGYALAPSVALDEAGEVAVFPLDHPGSSQARIFGQGNSDGDPAFPSRFEAGEIAADGDALWLAYPDDSRLGRIGAWKTDPKPVNVEIPFQPSGLWRDGSELLALGRGADGVLILGSFDAGTLAVNALDTLTGFAWDGVVPAQRGPKLAGMGDYLYAVDGNSPARRGKLLKIKKSTRRVESWVELSDGGLNDLAVHGGRIYVTSQASSRIRVFDAGPAQVDSIATGMNTDRIAFATEGRLRGCAFVTTDENAVLVIRAGEGKPVARLPLSGNLRGLAVDGRSGTVLVADGGKIHIAQF
ncbi:MAG TPA: hypothetical protein VJ385_13915 [Fibrobacteria bacterium]|nr:hypothetical protein [Fibrobacteria bacterium]